MARIHPTACVEPGAEIAEDVEIGAFCHVGENVTIAAGCRLLSHVRIAGHTSIGARTVVHSFASLGGPPQSASYRGEPTKLVIGADCDIRESVTMNTGTVAGGGVTSVGDRGFFMAYAHVAHDCHVGNDVVFVNGAMLAGHCQIDDHVIIGGLVAAHQFVRIGAHAMIGGMSALRNDVIPFGLASGNPARLSGINVVGMRRRGFTASQVATARRAYRALFLGSGSLEERIAAAERAAGDDPSAGAILSFVRTRSKRPLTRADNQVLEPADDGA